VWSREVTKLLKHAGFEALSTDACVFVGQNGNVWLMIYVDDMAVAAATKVEIDSVIEELGSTFTIYLYAHRAWRGRGLLGSPNSLRQKTKNN
jgi:exosome complex RNA-binding protein Rrp4